MNPKKLSEVKIPFTSHKFEILTLTFKNVALISPESSDNSNKFICQIVPYSRDVGPRTHFEPFEARRLTKLNVENSSFFPTIITDFNRNIKMFILKPFKIDEIVQM